MNLTGEAVERFWSLVEKADGCWNWKRNGDKDGYGVMRVGGRRNARAHRVSWTIEHGPIPKGLWVLHHCDNPRCVRPSHLYVGTGKDNSRDREARGRSNHQWGAARHNAKLSEEDVMNIVSEYRPGVVRQKDIAEKYGVSQSSVALILKKKNWKKLERDAVVIKKTDVHPRGARAKKVTHGMAAAIRAEYSQGGISQQKLAEKYGIVQQMVSNIVLGKNW